jgi:ribonuclease J
LSTAITVFDGGKCIGGNKIYLQFGDNGVFFDFGINYKRLGEFYEEFLSPRPSRGIHDLVQTGQIPRLNIYRKDLIPGDLDVTAMPKLKIDAVFISHAHMDHVGRASCIDASVPFVSSPVSAAILKAFRDCVSDIEYEATYSAPRKLLGSDSRIVQMTDRKSAPFVGRDFVVAGNCSEDFKDFWSSCPGSRDLVPGELMSYDSFDFRFKHFEVDHSIYGANAYAIDTEAGWVVYTGDFRMHGRFKEKSERFVEEARKLNPKILVIEGTRMTRGSGDDSEQEVQINCLKSTMGEKGLVIADFSPRNFERLDTFRDVVKETGRQLVVLTKDAYFLDAIENVDPIRRMKDVLIYKDLKVKTQSFESEIFDRHGDKSVDPSEIAGSPESYIVCFSFWDMSRLLDIKPNGGTYIYSSSEAYTEEQVIDFMRLWNWLSFFNLKVRGFEIVERDGKALPQFAKGFHASGHASRKDLIEAMKRIDPEIVVPVHTEKPDEFLGLDEFKVVLPKEGIPIEIS